MIIESQAASPAVHAAAVKIARRCVGIIKPLLMPEAAREFYIVARDELETYESNWVKAGSEASGNRPDERGEKKVRHE